MRGDYQIREGYFQQALAYNPGNRTASHRLGLIAMVKREYPSAVRHLESAYKRDPDHPGIMKNLGYSYLWANQMKPAHQILSTLPEAVRELDVYTWWWDQLSRPDLANIARYDARSTKIRASSELRLHAHNPCTRHPRRH